MNTHLLLIFIIISGVMTADQIGPNKKSIIIKKEQETVILSCSYDTSSSYIWLYWYRQYPNRELQYLLYKGARSYSSHENMPDSRFRSTTSESSTELIIKSVSLSDSALYYCALRVEPSDTKSLKVFTKTQTHKYCFEQHNQMNIKPQK
ncbi:TCR-alpha V segment II-41 [Triplophysa rosa]|nr:TCR-alpha V segment II-41 [Triplophysa rosa]